MRIAAGVLMIVIGVINLMTGGCNAIFGAASEAVVEEGGGQMLFGFYQFALCGLEIAAGVVLFVGTAAMYIKIVSVMEVVSVGVTVGVYGGDTYWKYGLSIVTIILAFMAAQQIGAAAGGGGGGGDAAAPPPPAEEPPAPAAEG